MGWGWGENQSNKLNQKAQGRNQDKSRNELK